MQKDCQTVYAHPSWKERELGQHHRGLVPARDHNPAPNGPAGALSRTRNTSTPSRPCSWTARRPAKSASPTASWTDRRLPPRRKAYAVSLLVVAMPLKGVMLSYSDSNSAKEVRACPARGLCGDVYLVATPAGGPHRRRERGHLRPQRGRSRSTRPCKAWPRGRDSTPFTPRSARRGRPVTQFTSKPFKASRLASGRIAFDCDVETRQVSGTSTRRRTRTTCRLAARREGQGAGRRAPGAFRLPRVLDRWPRLLSERHPHLPLRRPARQCPGRRGLGHLRQRPARAWSALKSFGINFVYTHNYGCEPGSHLSFAEILRAADDVGMLVSFSQPHFGHYDWKAPDADRTNGYARHAEFYVRAAAEPSVRRRLLHEPQRHRLRRGHEPGHDRRPARPARPVVANNVKLRAAGRGDRPAPRPEPHRLSPLLGQPGLDAHHQLLPEFRPRSRSCPTGSSTGRPRASSRCSPCEYGVPFTWDWTMYRGWYKGEREFGSAKVPWEFCLAEWNSQFLGDRAFQISETEKTNLRWEAKQFRAGKLWHRWDYPAEVGSRALRRTRTRSWPCTSPTTGGPSAPGAFRRNSPGSYDRFLEAARRRATAARNCKIDWENLAAAGLQPGLHRRPLRDGDGPRPSSATDWIPTAAAKALYPQQLAAAGLHRRQGRPHFTSKDHNFFAGETVEKQLIIINNSRTAVTGECSWALMTWPEPSLKGASPSPLRKERQRSPSKPESSDASRSASPSPAKLDPGRPGFHPPSSSVQVGSDQLARRPRVSPRNGLKPTLQTKTALSTKGEQARLLTAAMGARCRDRGRRRGPVGLQPGDHQRQAALTTDGASGNVMPRTMD